jgi:hypothetical protein
MQHRLHMISRCILVAGLLWLTAPGVVRVGLASAQASHPATRVALFHVFLTDGTSVVSYGEYARVGDEVVLSMPLGAAGVVAEGPSSLQLLALPADWIDWPRTERYAASVRFQRYVETRAEADFAALSVEVAAMLSEISLSTETQRALAIADEARRMLVEWPAAHYGYRQDDLRDIVTLIDAAVNDLSAGREAVQLSLVASPTPSPAELMLGLPGPREQIAQLVTLAHRIGRPADRTVLLRAALAVLDAPAEPLPVEDAAAIRRSLESQLREERLIDEGYATLSRRLLAAATRAAARASATDVARLLADVDREDDRLGARRPGVVSALRAALEAQLEAARDLEVRRDHWRVRRNVYRAYVDSVSAQLRHLVRGKPALEAIRRMDGPDPARLAALQDALGGGADRLEQIVAPEALRATHEILVGAWQFAEHATSGRQLAVESGDTDEARTASAAAAGSILLLMRGQEELRAALEPPQLR